MVSQAQASYGPEGVAVSPARPDPVLRPQAPAGPGGGLHAEMIRLADPQPGQWVLDIGYGTGNLLLALGCNHPSVELIGLDPDLAAPARAQRKATRARIAVRRAAASPRSCPTQANRSTGSCPA